MMVVVTGMERINWPIMPLAKTSGKNAKTVARTVVIRTAKKSLNTRRTACSGVNLPVAIYCLVACTTTIASSTSNPRDRINEKSDRKFSVWPRISITPKVAAKVRGMTNPAVNASLSPTNRKSSNITKNIVLSASLLKLLKSWRMVSDMS